MPSWLMNLNGFGSTVSQHGFYSNPKYSPFNEGQVTLSFLYELDFLHQLLHVRTCPRCVLEFSSRQFPP